MFLLFFGIMIIPLLYFYHVLVSFNTQQFHCMLYVLVLYMNLSLTNSYFTISIFFFISLHFYLIFLSHFHTLVNGICRSSPNHYRIVWHYKNYFDAIICLFKLFIPVVILIPAFVILEYASIRWSSYDMCPLVYSFGIILFNTLTVYYIWHIKIT